MPQVQKESTHGFLLRLAPNTKLDDEKGEINFHYIRYVTPPKKRVLTFKGGGVRVFVYETQDLFDFATARSFTAAELARLDVLRLKEINRIKNLPAFKAESRSTIKMMHLMESQIQPDSKSLNLNEVTPSKEEASRTALW